MILETDVTTIVYIAAWNRQDHKECARLVAGRHPGSRPWVSDPDTADYEDEAASHGVTIGELLR